jgi:hypothetical protein
LPSGIAADDDSQNREGCQPEGGRIRSATSGEPVDGSAAPSAHPTIGAMEPRWWGPSKLSEYGAEKREEKVPERVSYSRKPRQNFHRRALLDEGAHFSIQELRTAAPAQSLATFFTATL